MFVVFAAWIGGAPRSAEADVTSVASSIMVGSDGSAATITVNATDTDAVMSVTTAGGGGDDLFAFVSCADPDDCTAAITVQGGGASVDVDSSDASIDAAYTLTLTLTLECSGGPEAITITGDDTDAGLESVVIYCAPSLFDEDVEIEKQSDDNGSYTFDWDASGGNCLVFDDDGNVEFDNDGSFDLKDNKEAQFYCESSVDLTIDERDDNDFVAIDDCENDDGVDVNGSSADFDISDLDSKAFCTWINDADFHATPTVVVGIPASISIVLTSATINCGGSTLVQVAPRSASGGPVTAGTTLVMTSSLGGSFQPSSTITSLFPITLANLLYTAPVDANGTTTITARAGNVQTSVSVQIVCQVAPTPSATSAPLRPPSAGDGGLLGSSGPSYLPLALALAAAAAVLALTAGARRFALATAETPGVTISGTSEGSTQPGGFALLASLVMLAVALLARRWR